MPDAMKTALPHGHDGARQELRELGRMIDALGNGIRGKLIG
jgi:hypothetical protein